MRRVFSKERFSAFLLGALCVMGALFLTGALKQGPVTTNENRYQMQVIDETNYHSIFVIDSLTGKVKTAYHKHKTGMQQVDHMGKSWLNY